MERLAEGVRLGSNGLLSWCDRSSTWECDWDPNRALKSQANSDRRNLAYHSHIKSEFRKVARSSQSSLREADWQITFSEIVSPKLVKGEEMRSNLLHSGRTPQPQSISDLSPDQLIRILGCTSALIRSASHNSAAR